MEKIKKATEDISDVELALNRYLTNGNISHLQSAYEKITELRLVIGTEIKELKNNNKLT